MPIVSGARILAVAIAVSHVMMQMVATEQETGVRQTAAVYIDGLSATIHPRVAGRNLREYGRSPASHDVVRQGMQEPRAIIQLPDGTLFADVSGVV